ncbi:MAG: patatin-like phospholipase family protein [Crocinitomicaceae bacterium]|nr:patatin-like phospholipase family protein [Crocinitomicaceae bacterium]
MKQSHKNILAALLLFVSCLFLPYKAQAQSVGVVLSGGGATALTHVGFLRVLEENDIPIDYIGGTSMGAMIAGLYASGYSIDEIEAMVRSHEFYLMSQGEIDNKLRFYYHDYERDATLATLKYFGKGELVTTSLPTNLINPVLIDWTFFTTFSPADAASGYNFDSLYVPFRCVGADVEHKKEIVFDSGPLNVAVRASSTYPFYLPPRRIDGKLMFDGGIYNNFPADIMYQEFMPDVIIGCNVSGEPPKTNEDDPFSLLQALILFRDIPQTLCNEMLVVTPPQSDIGTFDFDKVGEAINNGYLTAMDSLPVIQEMIDRRVTQEERKKGRDAFRKKYKPLIIDNLEIKGLDGAQKGYVTKMMGKDPKGVPIEQLKKPFFRIVSDDKIKSVFPIAKFRPSTGMYSLLLDIKKEKDIFVSFGGNFSSRSINTGFVGLRYNLFGKTSGTLYANSYFGRFYASLMGRIKWEFATKGPPFSIEGSYIQNRWDYYKSLSTFFEDVKPSFVLLNERVGTLAISMPAGNNGVARLDGSYAYLFDNYYQTTEFLSVDTADRTDFYCGIVRMGWERNTLNRKQYASKGTFLSISGKFVLGRERTVPGSTSEGTISSYEYHQWFVGKLKYTNYFFRRGRFHLGLNAEGVISTQNFFSNYISSVIISPAFQPITESTTFFLPQYRAHRYVAAGLSSIFEIGKNLDIRMEGYAFNPFGRIVPTEDNRAVYDFRHDKLPGFIGSTSIIYHTFFGPVSISANYYDKKKEQPFSIFFNLGYIIFNRSARD